MTAKHNAILLSLLSWIPSYGLSESADLEATLDSLEATVLNPVVVTGTGFHQHLKSTPTPVTVITGTELRRTGITDFQDMLTTLVPNLSFSPNAMGSYLRMNGLSNNHVLVLVNGHKVNGDISGNIDLGQIDPNNIERIEILNGAASTLYGSDAIGGVINVITKEPTDETHFRSDSRYTRHNQFNQGLSLSLRAGRVGSFTTYNYAHSDGWQNMGMTAGDGDELVPTIAQLSLGFTSNRLGQKFTWDPTDRLSLTAEGSYYHRILDRPLTHPDVEGGMNYNTMSEAGAWSLSAKYRLTDRNSLTLDYNGNTYNQYYRYEIPTGDYQPGDHLFTKGQTFNQITAKGFFNFAPANNTVFGLDWRRDYLDRPESNLKKGLYTLSAFAQHEIVLLERFTILGGLRYDYHEQLGSRVTPKLALMYKTGDWNFRANYAAGYRTPGIDELYYRMFKPMGSRYVLSLGNPDLKSETGNYFGLNIEYTIGRFTATLTGYINNVKNMVTTSSTKFADLTPEQQQRVLDEYPEITTNKIPHSKISVKNYYNFEEARVKGIEFSANALVTNNLTIGANYSLSHGRGRNADGSWQRLNRSILHSATVTANYTRSWNFYTLTAALTGRIQSKTYYPGDADGDAPGFGVWNLNTRHTFNNFSHFKLTPGLGIENIFDRRDMRPLNSNFALYSPGRSVVVSLTIEL